MPRSASRDYVAAIMAITCSFGLLLATWVVLTPPYRAPDEPQHLNSVVRIEFGHGWPPPGEARFNNAIYESLDEAWFDRPLPGRHPGSTPNGFEDQYPPTDPVSLTAESTVETADSRVDQMTQHPPLYYGAVGLALRLLGIDGASWETHLLIARVITALMVLPVPALVAATVRRLTGSARVAVLVAVLPIGIPQFLHINASVTNDALVTVLASVIIWLSVRVATGPASWPITTALAVSTGLALFSKGFAMALVPLVLGAVLISPGLSMRSRLSRVGLGVTVTIATGGFWWLMNLVRYGTLQPHGLPARWPEIAEQTKGLRFFFSESAQLLAESFWGRFGWLELPIARPVSLIMTALLVAGVAAGGYLARRRLVAYLLLSVPVIIVAILLGAAYRQFQTYGMLPGLQGRYLFASIVAFGSLIAFALVPAMRSRHWAQPVALTFVVVMVALTLYGLVVAYQGFYVDTGERLVDGLDAWSRWAPGGAVGVALALVSVSLTFVALCYAALQWRRLPSEQASERRVG